jgi:hypothetical protein
VKLPGCGGVGSEALEGLSCTALARLDVVREPVEPTCDHADAAWNGGRLADLRRHPHHHGRPRFGGARGGRRAKRRRRCSSRAVRVTPPWWP